MSTLSVAAAPVEVYSQNGLVLNLDNDTNGHMRLFVENKTGKDMYDVTLQNQDIKGLTTKDKEIKVGTIKAGEKREVEFKYELEKAVVSTISQEAKNDQAQKGEGTIVKTSDESTSDNGLLKIAVPIAIAGVAGTLVIFAAKRKKGSKSNKVAMMLGLGALGTMMLGATADASLGNSINPQNGRAMFNVPIKGVTEIEGQKYDYAGAFYFENDHVETKLVEEKVAVDVEFRTDDTLEVGKFSITESDVAEGVIKKEITLVNGQVSQEDVLTTIPAKNYVVTLGTKTTVETSAIPHGTVYVANKGEEIGVNSEVAGIDGELTKTTIVKEDKAAFKDLVLKGQASGLTESELLKEVKEEVTRKPVDKKVLVGTKSTENKVIARDVVYVADTDALVGTDTVAVEGADGVETITYSQEVDVKTGALLSEKTKEASEVTLAPQAKTVKVGAKEVVQEPIAFDVDKRTDASQWTSFFVVNLKGEAGSKTVTYNHTVNSETGEKTGRTMVDTVVDRLPKTQVETRGTKTHEWVTRTVDTNVVSMTKDLRPFVTDISQLDSNEKLATKDAEFVSRANGNANIIDVAGHDGAEVISHEVAVKEDGSLHPDFQPRNRQAVATRQMKTQVELFKNYKVSDAVINFVTQYTANPNALKGTNTTVTKGENGSKRTVQLFSNAQLTTPVANGSVTFTTKQPTTAQVSVGTKEVEVKTLKYTSSEVTNDQLWDNYRGVKVVGKDGSETTTYTSDVNAQTGALSNRRVADVQTVNPINEVIEIGTKRPGTKLVENVEVLQPAATRTETFVSAERFAQVKTMADYRALLSEFNALKTSENTVSEDIIVKVAPKSGKVTTTIKQYVDPANNEVIPSYQSETVGTVREEAVQGVNTKFNVTLGAKRATTGEYTYVADDNMLKGQSREEVPAVVGEEQEIILSNGTKIYVPSEENPGSTGVIRVGTKEVITEERELEVRVVQDNTEFLGTTWNTPGRPEITEIIKKYEVDLKTGQLKNPIEISRRITQAGTQGNKIIGILKPIGQESPKLINEFLQLYNQERSKRGLSQVTLYEPYMENAQDAANRIAARKAQFNILGHVSLMDSTVTMVTDLQVDPDQYASKALRQLIASSAHREIIMHKNARHVAIGVNVYYNERFDAEEVVFTVTPVDANGVKTRPQ